MNLLKIIFSLLVFSSLTVGVFADPEEDELNQEAKEEFQQEEEEDRQYQQQQNEQNKQYQKQLDQQRKQNLDFENQTELQKEQNKQQQQENKDQMGIENQTDYQNQQSKKNAQINSEKEKQKENQQKQEQKFQPQGEDSPANNESTPTSDETSYIEPQRKKSFRSMMKSRNEDKKALSMTQQQPGFNQPSKSSDASKQQVQEKVQTQERGLNNPPSKPQQPQSNKPQNQQQVEPVKPETAPVQKTACKAKQPIADQSNQAPVQKNTPAQAQQTVPALTPSEQEFANSLSFMHKQLFISCFGVDQRKQAMAYVDASKMNKTTGMTNDMAVEMVLKNCRGIKDVQMSQKPSDQQPIQQASPLQENKKRRACIKNSIQ